ncbi:hypothetical protein UCRPC4_g05756 [Phaeomoniella chlamydospora]|uniref:Uncharacterized protein n=1 Tax=Phaeomoniella chlamydospora TaxID=158046 RepID=A0A0G2E222_PHACM|nr:hypothetical protein UCRPC4_g05756 [Phaeomoniella chlamydospora]
MSLNALLFSLSSNYTAGDLAAVSKHLETWPEVLAVVSWKVVELGIFWFSGLDAFDTGALSLLLNYPSQILLQYFYSVRPTTLIVSTAINVLSTTLPFSLLRPNHPIHSFSATKQKLIPRLTRSIISDPATTLSTSLLAATIVAVVLEFSFATRLPTFLITHFPGLRTLEPAHKGAAGLPLLLVHLIPLGFAAREFLFVPSAAALPKPIDKAYTFDPKTATLGQTIWHNVWGWYSGREKALIRRTILAVGLTSVETAVQIWATVKGAEVEGALGYAGVWGLALAIVGAVFAWVGGPSGF